MKLSNEAGFTIIETMLFLGITGLLVMGVLIGTGTSINAQRYRDSVSSFQSILQQQYSDVSNVGNDRDNKWTCDRGSHITQQTLSGVARGQSDCVILGRFITTTSSNELSIKTVVGYIPSNSTIESNDVDELRQYNINVSPVTNETYDIEWGASLVRPGTNTAMVFSMLVLRSPSSGTIRTFIDSNSNAVVADNDVAKLVTQPALMQSAKVCVVDSSGLFSGVKTAVVVDASATSGNGVEVLGEATSGC